jgi:hypothetical protein
MPFESATLATEVPGPRAICQDLLLEFGAVAPPGLDIGFRHGVHLSRLVDTIVTAYAADLKGGMSGRLPRKNARPWKATLVGALARNEALKACHRLGRSIWKKWSGYHRRSLVETKMHGFKRLGERVMARTFERQVVELHVRAALLNRFTQLGHPTTVPVAAMA